MEMFYIEEDVYFDSQIWYPSMSIINFLFMIALYVIAALARIGKNDVIRHDMEEQADKYGTKITPADWTFHLWTVIFIWQALWIIYSLVNICRKSSYRTPRYMPAGLFINSILLLACCIAWFVLFDRDEVIASLAVLIAFCLFLYAALAVSYVALDRASPDMLDEGRKPDIWLTRVLVHNSLGLQAGWVTVLMDYSVAIVMSHRGDPDVDVTKSSAVSLALVAGGVLIYSLVDFFILDRYTRYTVTPLVGAIVILSGTIDKNWDEDEGNSIAAACILAVTCLLFVIKLVLTVYRHYRKPRYTYREEKHVEKHTGSLRYENSLPRNGTVKRAVI